MLRRPLEATTHSGHLKSTTCGRAACSSGDETAEWFCRVERPIVERGTASAQAQGGLLRAITRGVTECFTGRFFALTQRPEANGIRYAASILHMFRARS